MPTSLSPLSRLFLSALACALLVLPATAQRRPEAGREYRRTGIHDGNLVYTRFANFGNLGSRSEPPKMEWPKGSGQWYGFEFAMMAGAEVVDAEGRTVQIVSENYTNPGSFDISPDGSHTYGWEPLAGYFNPGPSNDLGFPAMSNMENTWPATWPHDYPGAPGERDGRWNGEFGAYTRADQESYYVMDDRNNDEFKYYPFTGSSEDSTNLRGLGLEVAVRGYQWVNVQAEDILIVRYDITNVSDKDLDKVVFGMYVDPAIGGEGDSVDDLADFQAEDDITYMWDRDGLDNKGRPGLGYFGFAFLESPGDPLDGLDNNENGITDENQDDDRGARIEGQSAILSYVNANYDVENFIAASGPIENQPAYLMGVWWTGDEDLDWVAFEDLNGNGTRDDDERILDDKGSDGVGPDDEGYLGPDSDGTEGNNQPDQGEPNFGKTDNNESDQIGLTSFLLRPAGNVSDDARTWSEMEPGRFGGELPSNVAFIYGSGYFSLPVGETRKFAIATVFGTDLDDIIRNKRTMQRIYDADYSFAKPPNKPILTATAGDGEVVLKWDDSAELSRDPIYGRDFEGYLIYRSTDPSFNNVKTITDAYGNPILWKPIAQFDKKNGLEGPHPIQIGESGAVYNTGGDTGLQYYYVDKGLDNGRRYYYAVVSYDSGYDTDFFQRGIAERDKLVPIAPSESPKIIQTDLVGNVVFLDRNTASVVPNAPASGYVAGGIEGEVTHTGPATGRVDVDVVLPDSLENANTYRVTFTDTTKARLTKGIRIEELNAGRVVYESAVFDSVALATQLIDGMLFKVYTPPTPMPQMATWTEGNSTLRADVALPPSNRGVALPEDVEIRIKDMGVDTSYTEFVFQQGTPVDFEVYGTTTGQKYDFFFDEVAPADGRITPGDVVTMVFDARGFQYSLGWAFTFAIPASGDVVLPEKGDVFTLKVSKPYSALDEVTFSTRASAFDDLLATSSLDDIYVVPDPYVTNASWERPLFNAQGRGERRIDFVNLPPQCTITIYNTAGKLVQTLYHDAPMQDGTESWDLVSKDGLSVSFGVYIYHVDAPGIGERIGKFTLIK